MVLVAAQNAPTVMAFLVMVAPLMALHAKTRAAESVPHVPHTVIVMVRRVVTVRSMETGMVRRVVTAQRMVIATVVLVESALHMGTVRSVLVLLVVTGPTMRLVVTGQNALVVRLSAIAPHGASVLRMAIVMVLLAVSVVNTAVGTRHLVAIVLNTAIVPSGMDVLLLRSALSVPSSVTAQTAVAAPIINLAMANGAADSTGPLVLLAMARLVASDPRMATVIPLLVVTGRPMAIVMALPGVSAQASEATTARTAPVSGPDTGATEIATVEQIVAASVVEIAILAVLIVVRSAVMTAVTAAVDSRSPSLQTNSAWRASCAWFEPLTTTPGLTMMSLMTCSTRVLGMSSKPSLRKTLNE